jgi:hypothetical protein
MRSKFNICESPRKYAYKKSLSSAAEYAFMTCYCGQCVLILLPGCGDAMPIMTPHHSGPPCVLGAIVSLSFSAFFIFSWHFLFCGGTLAETQTRSFFFGQAAAAAASTTSRFNVASTTISSAIMEPSNLNGLSNDPQGSLTPAQSATLLVLIVVVFCVGIMYPWWRRKISACLFCTWLPSLMPTHDGNGSGSPNGHPDLATVRFRASCRANAAACRGADQQAATRRDSFWCIDSSPATPEHSTVSWFTHALIVWC